MCWHFGSFWLSFNVLSSLGSTDIPLSAVKNRYAQQYKCVFQPIRWIYYVQILYPQYTIIKCSAINRRPISATTHPIWLGAKLPGSKPTEAAKSHLVNFPPLQTPLLPGLPPPSDAFFLPLKQISSKFSCSPPSIIAFCAQGARTFLIILLLT